MSQLCLDCGLCCNGTLFGHADFYPRDVVNGVLKVPAQIPVQRRSKGLYFFLPCPAHDATTGCTVYAERPTICSGFECDLLKSMKSGAIDLEGARQIVAETKERAASLTKYVGPAREGAQSLPRRVLMLARQIQADPTAHQVPDSFAEDALALHQIIRGRFHKGKDPAEDHPMPDSGQAPAVP
jgi:uncharacterized protein